MVGGRLTKLEQVVMGMPVTVQVVAEDAAAGKAAAERAFEWFREVDGIFSTYKPASAISRINRGELQIADAPAVVREMLAECDKMTARTGDYFDARRPDGKMDPSGLVKGWAIGRAGELLRAGGFDNYCVEAGGDLVVRGHNDVGEPWTVGVRNPFELGQIVKVLRPGDGAVATSGEYERGQHIYDPHTGKAAEGPASVTVVGPDIAWADVAATAAFAMGADGTKWLARQKDLDFYWIDRDGQATFSPGLRKYLD